MSNEPSTDSLHIAARIWCEPQHAHKVMDPDLALSIATALDSMKPESQPAQVIEMPSEREFEEALFVMIRHVCDNRSYNLSADFLKAKILELSKLAPAKKENEG